MTTDQPAGHRINVGPGGNLDLDNLFTYHPPHGDQVARYAELRAAGRAFAAVLAETVPGGPERSTALARIREAVMWGNAGIACSERPVPALCNRKCSPGREDPDCPAHGGKSVPPEQLTADERTELTLLRRHAAARSRLDLDGVQDEQCCPHVCEPEYHERTAVTDDTTEPEQYGGLSTPPGVSITPAAGPFSPVLDEKAHPRGRSEQP